MDVSWSDTARRSGPHLACRVGCTQCCHGAFAINALDAARLRAGLDELRSADPMRAAAVEQRTQAWLAEHGPAFPGDASTGQLGDSEADQQAFEEYANDAACPALDPVTGQCDLYAWRPMTCRVFGPPVRMDDGVLACCELCFTNAADEEIAASELHIPHEREEALLREFDPSGSSGDTIVAYALIQPAPVSER